MSASIWNPGSPIPAGLVTVADLSSTDNVAKGAGQVGYSAALAYAAGTVGAKLREVVSVKDAPFNATGNGVTDDYTAIQAAIDSLDPNVGGVVEFPPGRYIVGATIAITRNNVTLRGQRGAVIKQKDNMPVPGWPPIIDGRGSMIAAFQKRNITFENLTLDGNKANNNINDNYGNGINIYDCQRVTVRGCHLYAFARDGITVSDYTRLDAAALGNEDIIIDGNLITDCRAPSQTTGGEGIIVVQGNKVVIANNILAANWRGIEIETLPTTGLYRGCVNLTVTGNVCLNNEYGGIGVNGASQLTLTGNICAGAAQYGIRINNSTAITASEIVVSGNRIKGATTAGLTAENYEQLQLLGNHIQSCTIGLLMSGVKDITVQNNVVSGSLQHGVQFTAGTNQNVIFTGNLIRASGQTTANTYDNLTGNAVYCVLSGNRLDGASARYGINAAGSSWTIIGNALDNSGTTGLINDTTSGGGARIRNNGGYITEAVGTATINSGSTSVVVNHGCSKTPGLGSITVTLGENPTNTAGDVWISSIGATQFTINCRNNPGASNLDVGWKVLII